jgi:hypothetical protein
MESRLASTMATLWLPAATEQPLLRSKMGEWRGASNYAGLIREAGEICEFAIFQLGVVTSLCMASYPRNWRAAWVTVQRHQISYSELFEFSNYPQGSKINVRAFISSDAAVLAPE